MRNDMTSKNKVGRPTVMTPEVVGKLEQGFMIGLTDVEACLYADINKTTLYEYCEKHPEFTDRKEMLKRSPILKAKSNIAQELQAKDKAVSMWYLERKAKDEFGAGLSAIMPQQVNIQVVTNGEQQPMIQVG